MLLVLNTRSIQMSNAIYAESMQRANLQWTALLLV
jgi:hypothetical protein